MNFYFKSLYQEIVLATIEFLPEFLSGLFIFALFYTAYLLAGKIFDRIFTKGDAGHKNVTSFLKKSARIALITFGFITMLGTWGIDIRAIIAGLGLTGFALGFALKDSLASILAGILSMVYKPFKVGDNISTCGVEGKVISIDMRYTTLEAESGIKHLVPNSKLLSERVTLY